jgi:hypothetical protein
VVDLSLLEHAENFASLFKALPNAYLILLPDEKFTILDVDTAYLKATNTIREEIVGRPLFDVFPDDPRDPNATGVKNLTESLKTTIREKKPHKMPVQKYNIPQPGSDVFEERYWSPINTAVSDKNGTVICIIHHVSDVTEYAKLKQSYSQVADQVKESNNEIVTKVKELQDLNVLLIQRETRMSELKEENKRLVEELRTLREKVQQ